MQWYFKQIQLSSKARLHLIFFVVSADARCPSSNMCEQVCYINDVTAAEICACNPGFELDANEINCSGKLTVLLF